MADLLPCPFCGEQPGEYPIEPHRHFLVPMPDHHGSHFVECGCGSGMIDETRDAVLARWNRRAALASAPGAMPVAYIQRDHLQKARLAPFLCRVEPTQRAPDMDPIYLDPPAPDPAGGLSDADIAHRWEADFEWDGPLWSAIKQWEEKGGETRVDAVEREVRRLMREAATPVDPAGDPLDEQTSQPWYDLAWSMGAVGRSSLAGDELDSISFTPDGFERFCARLAGASADPAGDPLVPEREAGSVHAECRECRECEHIGINDESSTNSTCSMCDWSGLSPKADRCPQCQRDGTMSSACPKCGGRYHLIADATLRAAGQPEPGR